MLYFFKIKIIKEMKKIILLIITIVFVNNIDAQKLSQSKRIRIQKCTPWRSVTGYNSLCRELNSFNCASIMCTGTSSTTVSNSFLLQDLNNSIYTFSSNQAEATTKQSEIMSQVTNWAHANKPANYFIESINYKEDIITGGGVTYAGINIKVTYKLCDNNITLPN
jgi:hypothetical protein